MTQRNAASNAGHVTDHVAAQSRLFALGDIQGCYDEFTALLTQLNFDECHDRLWLCGDLVNRGPTSLEVLRHVMRLESSAQVVLGNHDLHLLAVAHGTANPGSGDTLDAILSAPDRDDILHWLVQQPLLVQCEPYVMVHAGIYPRWTLTEAIDRANEVERVLKTDPVNYFKHMYGNEPDTWHASLTGWERLRFITNAFTRMRYTTRGKLFTKPKGPPAAHPELTPWYEDPERVRPDHVTVFGHWATLGVLPQTQTIKHKIISLDTGCVWGGQLTAIQLLPEPHVITQVKSLGKS